MVKKKLTPTYTATNTMEIAIETNISIKCYDKRNVLRHGWIATSHFSKGLMPQSKVGKNSTICLSL